MNSRIHIEAELSRKGLLELREQIDALLGDNGGPANPFTVKVRQREADSKIQSLWARVGDNARRFLATAAVTWPEGAWFSINDVAELLEVSPKTVRSWHRNLGRSLKSLDTEFPDLPVLLKRWDG